jgi:hypothetical protein
MERRETMAEAKKVTTKSPAKKPETNATKKTIAPKTTEKTVKTKEPKTVKPKVEKVKVPKEWVRSKTGFDNYKDAQAAQKTSKDGGKPARIVRVVTFFIETKQPIKPVKE